MSDFAELFNGKNILITGGIGFIGSNLAMQLTEYGANITLVDSLIPEYGGNLWNIEPIKNKITVNISDVRDEYSMRYLVKNQDFLFNLAGQTSHLDSMNNPFADLEINARAQLSILESCRKFNPEIKIIFAGTRQIYGKPNYLPVDENHPVQPVDVNGINKLAGEQYHLLYNDVYSIRSTVLRLTNTYGPRMRIKDARQTFLGIWIRRILENQPLIIFGDGSQIRDFSYIDDVVSAMLMAASSDISNGKIYNLGDSKPISLLDTANELIECYGGGSYQVIPFPAERKAIDIGDYFADFSKFSKDFGWFPQVSIAEGLKKTIEFYREFLTYYV